MRKLILLFMVALTCNSYSETRVYVDIVGDLFHAGHIGFFKKAKELGDYLIVGVHSDEDVAKYKRTPILTMHERAEVIEACKYVDEIILYAPVGVTKELIVDNKIDLVLHGDDFNKDTLMDQYGVPRNHAGAE